ncbi:MAG: OmpA family protein [Acidocella sp.]|nr:OmpA family protein [Acidocella sp.]
MKPIYLALLLTLAPTLASAQVIIHQDALEQLAGVMPSLTAERVSAEVVRPVTHVVHKHLAPKPTMVVAKPPVVTPVTPPVTAPALPPAAPPVIAPAPMPTPLAPVSVGFAPGSADLPAGAPAALKPLCQQAGAGGLVAVDAYAPADASDKSAPMRLSLSRAMAVRDALVACGVPPSHIIPRADGAVAGHGPDSAIVGLGVGASKQ